MNSQDHWIAELAAVSASSPQLSELGALEVGFEVAGVKRGLELSVGRVTDGSSAVCWLTGSNQVFSELVSGEVTLQHAYVTGQIQLSGEPEGFLRFALLLDTAEALRQSREGAEQIGRVSDGRA